MARKFKPIPTVPFELLIKGHQGVNEDHEKYGSAEPTVSIVRTLHKDHSPATAERAQISSRRLKSSDNSQRPTPPAAHSPLASAPTNLLDRPQTNHLVHPRHSNPHSPRRAIQVPPAISSLGGLRTPAPVHAAPPS